MASEDDSGALSPGFAPADVCPQCKCPPFFYGCDVLDEKRSVCKSTVLIATFDRDVFDQRAADMPLDRPRSPHVEPVDLDAATKRAWDGAVEEIESELRRLASHPDVDDVNSPHCDAYHDETTPEKVLAVLDTLAAVRAELTAAKKERSAIAQRAHDLTDELNAVLADRDEWKSRAEALIAGIRIHLRCNCAEHGYEGRTRTYHGCPWHYYAAELLSEEEFAATPDAGRGAG